MNPDNKKTLFRNAFVSVSNKEGIVDFIKPLVDRGMRVVSTGGTADLLKKSGIPVVTIKEQTGCEEVMGGRVKSLHPRIHIPLLARADSIDDQEILKKEKLDAFDLLVCNLYPFEKKQEEGEPYLVDWIDVGGPSMLRAAAKNFQHVTVVCDPTDYSKILAKNTIPSLEKRRQLAAKVFRCLTYYNANIAQWMSHQDWQTEEDFLLNARFFKPLRYGENPHQKASWFQTHQTGLHQAICLQGKELSFNNICDLNAAISTVREFIEPCCVAIKHHNPCGVATGKNLAEATQMALKADPVSVFGGVVALNKTVSEEAAKTLNQIFLEVIIAPDFSKEALNIFQSKKNLRILKWSKLISHRSPFSIYHSDGGILVQDNPLPVHSWQKQWKSTGQAPPPSIQEDLLMAWKICTHLKSNAIALVFKHQSRGLAMGQVSRISAVKQAIQQWKSFHPHIDSPALASDGFFPFPDSVKEAAQAGVKWMIQPGGSMRDKEILQSAKELSINMILTGQRCFLH